MPSPERPVTAPVEVFQGYIKLPDAARLQVDFDVPLGATQADKDSAFLNALRTADGVEFDYLQLGEVIDHNGMPLVADPFKCLPESMP
jgi:hypothetical protein